MLKQFGIIGNYCDSYYFIDILIRSKCLTITNSVNLESVTGLRKTKEDFYLLLFSISLPELFVAIFTIVDPDIVGIHWATF